MSEPVPPEPRPKRVHRQPWRIITVRDTDPDVKRVDPLPFEQVLLMKMRFQVRQGRPPLPEGYVPPPGIDIEALLKQVPWPPPGA